MSMIGVARRVHNETVLCLIKVSVWKMQWFLLGKYVDNDFFFVNFVKTKIMHVKCQGTFSFLF